MGEQSTGRARRVRRFLVDGDGVHDRHWHSLTASAPPLSFVPHTCTSIDIGHSPLAGIKPTVRVFAEGAKANFPKTATNSHLSSVTKSHQASAGQIATTKPEPLPTAPQASLASNPANSPPPTNLTPPVPLSSASPPPTAPAPQGTTNPVWPGHAPTSPAGSARDADAPLQKLAGSSNAAAVRPRTLSGSGQIAPPDNGSSVNAEQSQPPTNAASPRTSPGSTAGANAVHKRLSNSNLTTLNEQSDALKTIVANRNRRRPTNPPAIASTSALPPLPIRTEAEPDNSVRNQPTADDANALQADTDSTPPPPSTTENAQPGRDSASHTSAPVPSTAQNVERPAPGPVETSETRNRAKLPTAETTTGPVVKNNLSNLVRNTNVPKEGTNDKDCNLSSAKPRSVSSAPNTSENQSAAPTAEKSSRVANSSEQGSENATKRQNLSTPAGSTRTPEATPVAVLPGKTNPATPATKSNVRIPHPGDRPTSQRQDATTQSLLRRTERPDLHLQVNDTANATHDESGAKEIHSRRAVEKDVPLSNSTGKVNDPRSPQSSKNAVKLIKVQMPRASNSRASKPLPSASVPQEQQQPDQNPTAGMMDVGQPEVRREMDAAAASDRTPRRNSRTPSNPTGQLNSSGGTKNNMTSGMQGQTSKAMAASSDITTNMGQESGKEAAQLKNVQNNSSLTHDREKYLSCVKVLTRMLRRHNKNQERLKENGGKINILKSRNNLLQAVVDKLQNMDASLNHGGNEHAPDNVASEARAQESSGQVISGQKSQTPRSKAGTGTNLHPQSQTHGAMSRKASAGDSAERLAPGHSTEAAEPHVELDTDVRMRIVLESRSGLRELSSYFQKLSQDPSKISLGTLRLTLGKFNRVSLREMQKLGSNASEYTAKELVSFLEGMQPASAVWGFLWDSLKVLFSEYKSCAQSIRNEKQFQMTIMIKCLSELVCVTSLLSSWISFRWRVISKRLESGKSKDEVKDLQFVSRLCNFYRPSGVAEKDMPKRFLGRLEGVLKGLENRHEDAELPLKDERLQLSERLKECFTNLQRTCTEACKFEKDKTPEPSELAAAQRPTQPQSSSNSRITDDGRSESMKRKVVPDGQRDNEHEVPAKRRATAAPNASRPATRADDRRTSTDVGPSSSRFIKPTTRRSHPDEGANGRASSSIHRGQGRNAASKDGIAEDNGMQKSLGTSKSEQGKEKAKKTVRWAEEPVSGSCESKMDRTDVQTLFNDGYDLLGTEGGVVQQQAVEERASQMQRGAVISLYGYLRSYVEMLTMEVEGQQPVNPEWITLPYTPAAVRRMIRDKEGGP